MKKVILGLAIISSFGVIAQNLVKNPELKTTRKPTCWSQISKAEGWGNANGATTDIFEKGACKRDVGIDQNYMGTQTTDGNNYAGIIAYYDDQRVNLLNTVASLEVKGESAYGKYAEYLQGELTEGLTAGKSYTFSFKVSLAEMSGRAVKGLGAYFTSERLAQKSNAAIEATPQVVSAELIKTKDGWAEVKGTFTAKGGEKFLTIGAFKGNFTAEKIVADNQNDSKKAFYYIYGPSLVPAGGKQFANFDEIKNGKKVVFLTLNFETGKANITSESHDEIDACAKFLNNNPEVKIQIDGHTDAVGAADVNQKLSEERANAVREYLINKGVGGDRMKTAGYGETKPLETSGGDANPKNRRIELYMVN